MKKYIALPLLSAVLFFSLAAGEQKDARPPRWKKHEMEKVFFRLDSNVRKELMQLQRSDPEAFKKEMQKHIAAYREKKAAENAAIEKIIELYRQTADPAVKEECRRKLAVLIADGFDRNLRRHQQFLEKMKRRTVHLEKKLNERVENREKIINSFVDALLDGRKKLHHPGK